MTEPGVSMKEYVDALNAERAKTAFVGALGIIAVGAAIIWGIEKATAVALSAANEKGVAHNGLIDRMREMARLYVTWPVVVLLFGFLLTATGLVLSVWGKL